MARARVPSTKELAAFLVGHGIVDFVSGGTLSRIERNALWKVLKKAVPIAARMAVRTPVTMAGSARILAMRHPVAATAAVIYVGYHERERIKQLLDQGYDIIEERLPTPSLPPSPPSIPGVEEIITGSMVPQFMARPPLPPGARLRRRGPSKFNKAVSAGMKAVKKSTSYGKRGIIKPAKKAFALVTKLASAKKKKRKAPKSGIRRKIWNAMKGLR